MVNLNILLPDDLHKDLKLSSVQQDMSLKDYIIKQLEDSVKPHG